MVADLMTGTEVSSVTVRETVVFWPAASLAVTTMVLLPSRSVTDLVKLPLEATVTAP